MDLWAPNEPHWVLAGPLDGEIFVAAIVLSPKVVLGPLESSNSLDLSMFGYFTHLVGGSWKGSFLLSIEGSMDPLIAMY